MFCIYFGNFRTFWKIYVKYTCSLCKTCSLSGVVTVVINYMLKYLHLCQDQKIQICCQCCLLSLLLPFSSSLNLPGHPVLSFASYNLVHFSFPYIRQLFLLICYLKYCNTSINYMYLGKLQDYLKFIPQCLCVANISTEFFNRIFLPNISTKYLKAINVL